jgi:hypothetical protein
VAQDFRDRWRQIVTSKPGPFLNSEGKRKRSGNQEQIIQMSMKKGPPAEGLD